MVDQLLVILVIAVTIFVVAVLLATMPQQEDDEPSEFGADFDAIQAEKDEAAKSRARCREREAINRQADRLIASAKFGRQHDGQEL